jgi:hypothetical protein
MLVSGSLAPVQRSFLRKPSPGPGFSDNSSTIASDNKNKQIKDSRGSSDLFDKMITFYQLGLVKETNQKVQTILETLAEIDGLKGSRNNSSAGDFA